MSRSILRTKTRRNPLLPKLSLMDALVIGGGAWLVLTPSGRGVLLSVLSGHIPFVSSSNVVGASGSGASGFAINSSSTLGCMAEPRGVLGFLLPACHVPTGTPISVSLGINHIGNGGSFIAGIVATPVLEGQGLLGQIQGSIYGAVGAILPSAEAGLTPYETPQQAEQTFNVNDDGSTWIGYTVDFGGFVLTYQALYDVRAYVRDLAGKQLATYYLGRVNVG